MNKTYYKSEDWLNEFESPSTGSIVCFDGWRDYSDGPDRCTFIEVADCQQKIRLHKAQGDTLRDFIAKAEKMRNALDYFIKHLKEYKADE